MLSKKVRKEREWKVIIAMMTIHLLTLYAVVQGAIDFSLKEWFIHLGLLAVCFFFFSLGITLGMHRLFTHNSFAVPKWLWYTIAVIAVANLQGRIRDWVATHLKHHAHSDDEKDPHSPMHGFSWAHIWWVCYKVDHEDLLRYTPKRLIKDKGIQLIDRFYLIPTVIFLALLYGAGYLCGTTDNPHSSGFTWLLWGGPVRMFCVYHPTWSVNSICHLWGYKNSSKTGDESRNNPILGILAMGEGWHNNHHAYPASAAHGVRWFEFDITYLVIRGLKLLGLAEKIREPKLSKLDLAFPQHAKAGETTQSQPEEQLV